MREIVLQIVVFGGIGGMIGNSMFDLFRHLDKSDAWRPLLFGLVGVVVLIVLRSRAFRRAVARMQGIISVAMPRPGVRRKALVCFVSCGDGRTSASQAAEYHLGVLEHLWLITSSDGKDDAEWVGGQIQAAMAADAGLTRVNVHAVTLLDDILSIPEAKEKVESIRRQAMKLKIPEDEIICDFTGLNKLASAGMILACAPRTALLQYMYPKRMENGRPVYAEGSTPREIAIAYKVAEEPEE